MSQKERDEELARLTKHGDEPQFVIPISTDPIPAAVVADDRDTFWRRVSIVALILVLVFFSANGYIQSARNAHIARDAVKEGVAVSESFKAYRHMQRTYNARLLAALKAQNKTLRKAGLPTEPIPEQRATTPSSGQGATQPNPQPQTSPQPPHRPSQHHHHHHKPQPSSSPSPKPDPCDDLQYKATHPLECLTGSAHVASTAYVGQGSVLRRAVARLWRACLAIVEGFYRPEPSARVDARSAT